MAKMSVKDLRAVRAKLAGTFDGPASDDGPVRIQVGLGTCGIAAGARQALAAFEEELEKAGVRNAEIRQTGCMGLCHSEPTVEVRCPGMPVVIYGQVDEDTARKIVSQHIARKRLVDERLYDRPAVDLFVGGKGTE